MKTYVSALCWAAAMLGVATAGAYGAIDEASVTTLLIVMPACAWMAITGRGRCAARGRA